MTLSFEGTLDLGRFTLDAAFACAPGETVALVGPNGSGKSTALTALAGLRRLSSGSLVVGGVIFDSKTVWVPPERRGVGMVFQDLLLFPHLDVRDNVAYGLRRRGVARNEARTLASEGLERLGIGHLAQARPHALSGGQAQRVALARALAVDPQLLLLDEPLSALDTETRLQVRCELHRHLEHSGGYAVLVAHDVVDVVVLADRVVVLESGMVAQVGTPTDIQTRPRTRFAAALFGTNLVRALRCGPNIELAPGIPIPAPSPGPDGPVDLVIAPRYVSVSPARSGSGGVDWPGTVAGVEAAGDDVHIRIGAPIPLAARATFDTLRELNLAPGTEVMVHIDPAGLSVFDSPSPFLEPSPSRA